MSEQVLVTTENHVAQVVLNNPEAFNAFDGEMLYAMARHFTALAVDPSVRAVVVTGAGKVFSAGANLKSVISVPEKAHEVFHALASVLHQSIIEIRRMRKPVIAAVNGIAAGAGMSLALACDFRVMGKSSMLRQAYTSWGLCIDGGGTFMLPRLVGLARSLEIAAFDQPITAAQALEWGLATKVVDDADVVSAATAMAGELANRSNHSFGWVKQLFTNSFSNPLEVQLEQERAALVACGAHPDGQEGMTAFATKRQPAFNKGA